MLVLLFDQEIIFYPSTKVEKKQIEYS